MKTSRRTFLKIRGYGSSWAAILPRSIFCFRQSEAKKEWLDSIIFDTRWYDEDTKGSLTQLAKMGYVYVEHANYVDQKFYGFLAPEFRKVLDGLGLKMISGHTVMGKRTLGWSQKRLQWQLEKNCWGCSGSRTKWVISPWHGWDYRKTYDDFKRVAWTFLTNAWVMQKIRNEIRSIITICWIQWKPEWWKDFWYYNEKYRS